MQWDDVRVFLTLERLGSQERAARQLHVDPTTIGRRVTALEADLGVRLFTRTRAGVVATPAGRRLVQRAERMELEALEAERELAAADARLEGAVRLTAPDGFLHALLLPALASFRREYPGLTLELRADTRVLDLSRREADVAVRLVRPKEAALVARRLGEFESALFASADYLERRGAPRNVAALAGHDFIGFDASLDALPQNRWLLRALPEPRYVLRATTTTAQVVACAEGHGIALLPSFVAVREPRLRRLLPRLIGPKRELWGVMHGDLRDNVRVRAVLAWLPRVLAEGVV